MIISVYAGPSSPATSPIVPATSLLHRAGYSEGWRPTGRGGGVLLGFLCQESRFLVDCEVCFPWQPGAHVFCCRGSVSSPLLFSHGTRIMFFHGWRFGLPYYMGIMGFSVHVCQLWTTAWINMVGWRRPILANRYTKWQINTQQTISTYTHKHILICE